MLDRERVRRAFGHPVEFTTSPLYRELSRTVAASDQLLDLACLGRPGQYPTFLFFGAVHRLLLRGVGHPLAGYYPSVAGDAALPAAGAGPALESFGRAYAAELTETIRTRLVQTSVVQRTLGLRIGLSAIAAATAREPLTGPLHVVEVGASAGLNLRFDRYGYRLSGDRYGPAGRQYGDPDSPVQLAAEVYGPAPLPDLDRIPAVGRVQGVDLNPVDAADPDAREWLEALVWPENHAQRELLGRALAAVAADPPPIEAGDAIDVLPKVAAGLPAGEPRLVFHTATRIHVPRERRAAFDAAILATGSTGPLWHLSVEGAPQPDPRSSPTRYGAALRLRDPAGGTRTVAVVDGHLRWIETLDEAGSIAWPQEALMARQMTIRFELFVADRDKSVDFYTSVLGFEVQRLDASYAALTCGYVTLGLGRQEELPETGEGPGFTQERLARDHGAGVEIVLETPDLDALYERVRRSGYPLAAPMRDRPWGLRDFRVADPDGYYLRITTPE